MNEHGSYTADGWPNRTGYDSAINSIGNKLCWATRTTHGWTIHAEGKGELATGLSEEAARRLVNFINGV